MLKPIYLMIVIVVFFTGCNKSGVDKNNNELLLFKESMPINDIPSATLTFFDVSDSRCPKNVQCVWAGNATVDLLLKSVTTEGAVSEHIIMCYGDCGTIGTRKIGAFQPDTLNHQFAGVNYQFILEEVNNEIPTKLKEPKYNYGIRLKVLKN